MTRAFLSQPTLGLEVRNRRQLLARLKEYDHEGLGGIPLSEIREALAHPDKAMSVSHTTSPISPVSFQSFSPQRLTDEGLVMKITRPDKEEVVFYNDLSLHLPMADEFRALWHCVSVDGLTEADIDKYLQAIGVGAMQGEARKRRAPTAGQKTKKKSRVTKVLNTHLDSTLLKDYSETQSKSS